MKTNTPTISVAETDYLLRSELGPLRNWTHFLSDCSRGKQDIAGHTLTPCAMKNDGRAFRPVYSVEDIKTFIADVRAAVPSAGKTRITPTILAIDDGRHYRANKFGKDGSPVKPHRVFSAGACAH